MGITKCWSKSKTRRNKDDTKSSKNLTEANKLVGNSSEAKRGASREKEAKRILDSIQNLEVILKDANISREAFSPQKLLTLLKGGILLNQKRQKYWVDKMGKNCFMIYPRDFHIIWGHDDRYWRFPKETSGNDGIEMAEITEIYWLDVSGSFDTTKLSLETLYEASFVVMMKEVELVLWDSPANSVRIQPDGGKRQGLSFVVMTENKLVWDTPLKEVPTVRLMMENKDEDGMISPLSFVPTQHDGTSPQLFFALTTKTEFGRSSLVTFIPSLPDGSRSDELSFVVKTDNKVVWDNPVKEVPTILLKVKSEDGTVSPMNFGRPAQPDESGHELSFAVMMKNETGLQAPMTFIPSESDGSQHGLSFAVTTENKVVLDTSVNEVPSALALMMKNEYGTVSPVSIVPEGSWHELLFAIAMKNEAGLYSPVTFTPSKPDGSQHELSVVIMMKNDDGQYNPVTFIPSQTKGSTNELLFVVMTKNEVVWETPVVVVPTLLEESRHELLFVVMMKNEAGVDTLVSFVPTQPDGRKHKYSFAVTMKNNVGWETPVNIVFTQPSGCRQEHEVMMWNLPREQWVEIPVGKFRTFPEAENIGKLKFFMYEHRNQLAKRGLIFKGLKIKAKIA